MITGLLLLCLATEPQCDRWSAALVIEGRFESVVACETAGILALASMRPGDGWQFVAMCQKPVAGATTG